MREYVIGRHPGANALAAISIAVALTACSHVSSPVAPTAVVASGPEVVHLEAEGGSGTPDIRKRFRASGGMTVHLAPGERLSWVFDVRGSQLVDWVGGCRVSNPKLQIPSSNTAPNFQIPNQSPN